MKLHWKKKLGREEAQEEPEEETQLQTSLQSHLPLSPRSRVSSRLLSRPQMQNSLPSTSPSSSFKKIKSSVSGKEKEGSKSKFFSSSFGSSLFPGTSSVKIHQPLQTHS
eukprot:TRINITY_DN19940_c0_g1_i1.p1 TRINITY_DN19940_c0_g1~~TRINITY_DN19940_c0_g1_i1.p1  ORF type:complete len:124 (-),score=27.23 TRINITY_DN19940_c0_g1_i1:18-344(-)